MPEHLRSLIVILILATTVFAFAKAPACAMASTTEDFERRRNLWFGITLTAFLAHNFWIYILVVAVLLLFAVPREPNKLAMFFFLLFAVPAIPNQISGMGIVQHFFTIHYIRLLALVVLLPAFLYLRRQPDTEPFGRSLPDKLIAGYIILNLLLMLNASTFTNSLRYGVFYAFIDIFLPYYVASRSLKDLQGFRDVLMGFAVAALVLGAIACFEFMRHWLLYSGLEGALGVKWNFLGYLSREGDLRAVGSTGQAIPLGYVMAVAIGFFLYLKSFVPSRAAWTLGMLLLIAGLIASISRGPWVGAAVMFLVFVATGASGGSRLLKLGLLGAVSIPILLVTPVGEKIVSYLPFVGTVEATTVAYRQRLLEISIGVILQNPLFGAYDYMYSPAMQDLKQGTEGFIDMVNSYLAVGLASGLVGLSLFAGFFIAVAAGIFKGFRKLTDRNDEHYLLGQALLATLLGIMAIIFTVSSITVIPVVYWSVAGLGVAYARMLALAKAPGKAPETIAAASSPIFSRQP